MGLQSTQVIPQVQAWLNVCNYVPTNGFIQNLSTLVSTMITNGDWANTDNLYILAGEDSKASLISIKNPEYSPMINNGATFASNLGFSTNGSSQYIDTALYPRFYSPNWSLNNAGMIIYQTQASPTVAGIFCGGGDAGFTNSSFFQPSGGELYGACNNSGSNKHFTYSTLAGWMGAKKTASNNQEVWFNGVQKVTGAPTNGTLASNNMSIGAFNLVGTGVSSYQAGTFAMFSTGAASIVNLNNYNAFQTFATSRGFNV